MKRPQEVTALRALLADFYGEWHGKENPPPCSVFVHYWSEGVIDAINWMTEQFPSRTDDIYETMEKLRDHLRHDHDNIPNEEIPRGEGRQN